MVTLENSSLLGQVPLDVLQPLLAAAREQRFRAGQEIFKEGDAGDGVYFVKDGLVDVSVLLGPGRRHTYARVGPGELFGEMAVIEDKPRSAGVVAVQDTTVDFIPREAVLALIGRSPEVALSLLRHISQRLRDFNRQHLNEVLQAERLTVVGRFARSIVHDLKNPLTIINLTAELAGLDTATPEMRRKAQERICRQVERIGDLVNEILEFTQGSHGVGALSPTDYGVFVEHVCAELQAELELKGVAMAVEGRPAGVMVPANPKRLRRVFQNLAHNAADAMTNGGRITVRIGTAPAEIVTEIEDNGPGIPPEMAARLFEPFATHGKAHGTGLGLSICKKIVEDHGGRIWARAQPGRGAVFAFALPLARETCGPGR